MGLLKYKVNVPTPRDGAPKTTQNLWIDGPRTRVRLKGKQNGTNRAKLPLKIRYINKKKKSKDLRETERYNRD